MANGSIRRGATHLADAEPLPDFARDPRRLPPRGRPGLSVFRRHGLARCISECVDARQRHGTREHDLSPSGKLFAGFYAMYSGFVVIALAGLLLSPGVHHLMHHVHWDNANE